MKLFVLYINRLLSFCQLTAASKYNFNQFDILRIFFHRCLTNHHILSTFTLLICHDYEQKKYRSVLFVEIAIHTFILLSYLILIKNTSTKKIHVASRRTDWLSVTINMCICYYSQIERDLRFTLRSDRFALFCFSGSTQQNLSNEKKKTLNKVIDSRADQHPIKLPPDS